MEILTSLPDRIRWCEANGAAILCCPEGLLGGLADYAPEPRSAALKVRDGQLARTLAPMASTQVSLIIGFTEDGEDGELYNAAAVFSNGAVIGIYRKLHPAIRRSVYAAGTDIPVFTIQELRFGIQICNDS